MRVLEKIRSAIIDPDRTFEERVFLQLTIISVVADILALIGDVLFKENLAECIVLALSIVLVPLISVYFVVYKRKVQVAARIIVLGLVFIILPTVFIYGGGVEGGGLPWIIFAYLYVGLVLSGTWRTVILILLTAMSALEYMIEFNYPQYIRHHTRRMFYTDSFISLVVVGMLVYIMVKFQNRLYMEENRRAREETERAEELIKSQNRFFSSMSHEIRTPINSILGLNEVILRQKDASDEIIRDAGNIQGAGNMLLYLINDILDFSKIEAGKMEIVPVDYKVAEIMSEIVNMEWLRAAEKGLKFNVDIDPRVPSGLYGDEIRIRQILINLLNNAVKYTQEGEVSLHIESDPIARNRVLLKISVSDTGIGIKKEVLPVLFDAFKRLDLEKNSNIEGTGLGLSIVKQLVGLMGGTISVDSVYGQGTTFTVNLEQDVSDQAEVGDISITNYGGAAQKRSYVSRFTAPDARILLVDDNEMNLMVEKKLLADTLITVDTASSGRKALEMTLANHYDVILMDHLMPGMDGIQCLSQIRSQTGGLNKDVPVIVLTANAGSEARELYHASGFDGYLVKPVSGMGLEESLLSHLPEEKLTRERHSVVSGREMNTASGYYRKASILITTSSMCDLPDYLVKELGLQMIPFSIHTPDGIFRDNVEIGSDELIRYIRKGEGEAISWPPDVPEYVEFFGSMLKRAHHVIHIALTSGMSVEYVRAIEAAKSFENVTVVDSEGLSSATGLLAMTACRLAKQNQSADRIVEELNEVKKRIHCGFIIRDTDSMAKRKFISPAVHSIARVLGMHPCLRFRNGRPKVRGIWLGDIRHCYDRYIATELRKKNAPDKGILFVTYVDLPEEELEWIESRIRRRVDFENIVFQQASAAISSNCGSGTFGLLFMDKGSRSYNLGGFLPKKAESVEEESVKRAEVKKEQSIPWFASIPGIDGEAAISNSGSEESFRTVLKMFYDSIEMKTKELDGFYEAEDWENYTIKVHAMKSSARMIGALRLGEQAQRLEDAGKNRDVDYLRANHTSFLEGYRSYEGCLASLFPEGSGDQEGQKDAGEGKKAADDHLMENAYLRIREAARDLDTVMLETIMEELARYEIPEEHRERVANIKKMVDQFDFDEILELLEEKGGDVT